jgi:MFS family permease
VARPDAEVIRKFGNRGFVEESFLDQPQPPRDGRRRAVPCRAPRRRFGSAAQTRPKACPFSGGCRGEELNVLRFRRPHSADRAAVNPGCPHSSEKDAIEGGIAGQPRTIAGLPIETEGQHRLHTLEIKDREWRRIAKIGLYGRITSDLGQHRACGEFNFSPMQPTGSPKRHRDPLVTRGASNATLYRGWLVVAAAFLVAMFGFGLGFYGPGIYLVALKARHGWSIDELSSAITAYYALGAALLFFVVGALFDRWGARAVVTIGTVAMACGVVLLTLATRLWQIYAAFGVMSLGWATTSGAAINIIVAPWFERRRGLALSWALNGGSAGGVIVAPLLVLAISRLGFAAGLRSAVAAMLAILIPAVALMLRPRRPDEHDAVDVASDAEASSQSATGSSAVSDFRLATVLPTREFITTSVPFALALTAQVGFITHQVAFLSPSIGIVAAGWAVSLTTFAAVIGRVATGLVVDRFDRRAVASLNFAVQALGMGLLAATMERELLYVGCVIFGIGVGNATSLPGLIVQREFPRQHFARIITVVVAINQFSFAFGPTMVAHLYQAARTYTVALLVCLAMQIVAAIVVLIPAVIRPQPP